MDKDVTELTLDEIKHWTVTALKDFLRVRGIKTTGRKEALVALVYSCTQLRVDVKPDEIEEDRQRSEQYAELLQIKGQRIPDPIGELKSDWIGEKQGVHIWPPVSHSEIADWLLNEAPCPSEPSGRVHKETSLHQRLLSDYKEGKAYSYFKSHWLQEVFYHPISDDSSLCILKSQCTPSQAVRSLPHDVWVAVDKANGKIYSAYCSCFAG